MERAINGYKILVYNKRANMIPMLSLMDAYNKRSNMIYMVN